MSFASLGLSEALVRAIEAAGYTQPTPVQQRAIPAVLQGRDLMVAAQTGTGKTGGFALPILERLFPAGHPDKSQRHGPRQPRVLVLTPTRELAAQVHDSFKVYARDLPLVSACVFGGVGMNPQVQAIAKGVDVLVACPGRLLDLAGQGKVDLAHVEILVLDEADRMLDMGFIHDVKKVLARLPAKRQNLLFSATFSKDITDLADKLLHNPERIEVTPPNTTVERIEQRVYRLPASHKRALLAHLITLGAWEQVLVFTRTKHGANRLAEYLEKHGLSATATRARTPAPRPWPTSRPTLCACWSPPISPHAAWISTNCPMWSTSSCRTSRKTTSTVLAAPAVPGVRARPFPWSRRMKRSCSRASSASPSRRSPTAT
jgi:ATP-dependent RNA helicase RhlE